jgi:MFS family permease
LFDLLGNLYARYRGGKIEPEARLLALWVVLPFKITGNILIGWSLESHWSYWILAVGWAMHNCATVITTTAVGAYLIDAYPEASGESAAWLNVARTFGGFIVGYVQIKWVDSRGLKHAYGSQAGIMAAAFALVIILQVFGKALRTEVDSPLRFKTR